MFSFDGSFRRKKKIDLSGGSSNKQTKTALVENLAKERQKREAEKISIDAATKIQACFRSHRILLLLQLKYSDEFHRSLNELSLERCAVLLRFVFPTDHLKLLGFCSKVNEQFSSSIPLQLFLKKFLARRAFLFLFCNDISDFNDKDYSIMIFFLTNLLQSSSSVFSFLFYQTKFYELIRIGILSHRDCLKSFALHIITTPLRLNLEGAFDLFTKNILSIPKIGKSLPFDVNCLFQNKPSISIGLENVDVVLTNFLGFFQQANSSGFLSRYLQILVALLSLLPDILLMLSYGDDEDNSHEIISEDLLLSSCENQSFIDLFISLKETVMLLVARLNSIASDEDKLFGSQFLFVLGCKFPSMRIEILSQVLIIKDFTKDLWRIIKQRSSFVSSILQGGILSYYVDNDGQEVYWCNLLLITEVLSILFVLTNKADLDVNFLVEFSYFGKCFITSLLLKSNFSSGFCDSYLSKYLPFYNKSDTLESWIVNCLKKINEYDSKKHICPPDHWIHKTHINDIRTVAQSFVNEDFEFQESFDVKIIKKVPFLIPFNERANLFSTICKQESANLPTLGPYNISRTNVLEEGFSNLYALGSELKSKVRIQLISELGYVEAGVDGGGVFKEFLTSLLKSAFNMNLGLFEQTTDHQIFPSPSSHLVIENHLAYFHFIGMIIGKALYSGILLENSFANFFLSKVVLRGERFSESIDELENVDPQLFRNLMFLRDYDGNVEDLSLNFSINIEELGQMKTVELIRNGSEIPVTNESKFKYIHSVANYKLNIQIRQQSLAFMEGFFQLINPAWIRIFNTEELGILLSGSSLDVDLNDLKRHTVYSGVFDENHETMKMFWKVLESFSSEEKRDFIKYFSSEKLTIRFVTSCSRPPILGFKELDPKFAIRDSGKEMDRLPSASTCFNLLKLPIYDNEDTLRKKLKMAISSSSGFELS